MSPGSRAPTASGPADPEPSLGRLRPREPGDSPWSPRQPGAAPGGGAGSGNRAASSVRTSRGGAVPASPAASCDSPKRLGALLAAGRSAEGSPWVSPSGSPAPCPKMPVRPQSAAPPCGAHGPCALSQKQSPLPRPPREAERGFPRPAAFQGGSPEGKAEGRGPPLFPRRRRH